MPHIRAHQRPSLRAAHIVDGAFAPRIIGSRGGTSRSNIRELDDFEFGREQVIDHERDQVRKAADRKQHRVAGRDVARRSCSTG